MKPSSTLIQSYRLSSDVFLKATPASNYEPFTWMVGNGKGWKFVGWIHSFEADLPDEFRSAMTPLIGLFEHKDGQHPKCWTHIAEVTRNSEIRKLLTK